MEVAMPQEERPLPKPPQHGKFGEEQENPAPVLADKIAEAMAMGNLEEFMDSEIPDTEQARSLVSMMMGMTGMLPPGGLKDAEAEKSPVLSSGEASEETPSAPEPPQEIHEAAQAADMETLVDLLKREQGKRLNDQAETACDEKKGVAAAIGREEIDKLLGIASDNNLSPDWVILRALRLYIREYEKTGRL